MKRSQSIFNRTLLSLAVSLALPIGAHAQDFWDEWPPDEGDCHLCPPVLAATVGGEIEWSIDHVGFSLDEEVWADIVELLDKIIDKFPGGDTAPDPEPEPDPEPDPDPDPDPDPGPGGDGDGDDDTDEQESRSPGRVVTLVEPVGVPQVSKQGARYFAEYQVPADGAKLAKALIVTKPLRLSVHEELGAAIVIPKGRYKLDANNVLRVPLVLRKRAK